MVYCPKCGTKNEDDATFCKSCGASLTGSRQNTTGTGINGVKMNVLVEKAVVGGQSSGESLLSSLVLRFSLKSS